MNALDQYLGLYRDYKTDIDAHAPELFNKRRAEAYESLQGAMLPEKGQESYEALSINDMFAPDYGVNINRVNFPLDTAATFHCGVPNISTLMGLVVNDSFRNTSTLLRNMPEGVTMMSLAAAAKEMPDFVDKYLGRLMPAGNAAAALNALLLQDGVMIHVAKGVRLERPLQIVNVFNAAAPIMAVRHILVVADDDAKASILVCDHSQNQDVDYLSNQVVEIYAGRNASIEYYDLEESSPRTHRLSQLFAEQHEGSRLTVNGSTLLGGATRNNFTVKVIGDNADTHLAGMAICTDTQVVDNTTSVHHLSKGCSSEQMFKYVLDDKSVGAFYGTIIVDEKAKFTNAYQTNRNILASADARMYTRPQLEIYCDDVKCSHGATVGQLDSNALFYMRSRGIPLDEARLMLMQAFMQDVIDTVSLPALKTRLQQLIESRLCGNKALCADCPM